MNVRYPLSVSPNSDESGKPFLYPDDDPDRRQNLTTCSLANCQPPMEFFANPFGIFLRKVANRQTNRQTNKDNYITSLAEVMKGDFHYCFKDGKLDICFSTNF